MTALERREAIVELELAFGTHGVSAFIKRPDGELVYLTTAAFPLDGGRPIDTEETRRGAVERAQALAMPKILRMLEGGALPSVSLGTIN